MRAWTITSKASTGNPWCLSWERRIAVDYIGRSGDWCVGWRIMRERNGHQDSGTICSFSVGKQRGSDFLGKRGRWKTISLVFSVLTWSLFSLYHSRMWCQGNHGTKLNYCQLPSSTLSFMLQLNITFVFPVFIFKPFVSNPDFHFTILSRRLSYGTLNHVHITCTYLQSPHHCQHPVHVLQARCIYAPETMSGHLRHSRTVRSLLTTGCI